jgi:hypothetical protein
LSEVNHHNTIAVTAIPLWNADKVRSVKNFPFRLLGWIVMFGSDEHITGKECMPSGLRCDPQRYKVLGMLANVQVRNKSFSLAQVGIDAFPKGVKFVFIKRSVDITPLDVGRATVFLDDISVCRRPTAAFSRSCKKRSCGSELPFAASDCKFD